MTYDIKIIGFEGYINSLNDFLNEVNAFKSKYPESTLQFVDASSIGGINHINHAVNQALIAFERNENLANDLSVEIVLRASAQRQISKAFNMLGLKEGESQICAIFINCPNEIINCFSNKFTLNNNVLQVNTLKLQNLYNISDKELMYMDIEDILIDRVTKLIVDY